MIARKNAQICKKKLKNPEIGNLLF